MKKYLVTLVMLAFVADGLGASATCNRNGRNHLDSGKCICKKGNISCHYKAGKCACRSKKDVVKIDANAKADKSNQMQVCCSDTEHGSPQYPCAGSVNMTATQGVDPRCCSDLENEKHDDKCTE